MRAAIAVAVGTVTVLALGALIGLAVAEWRTDTRPYRPLPPPDPRERIRVTYDPRLPTHVHPDHTHN